MHHRVNKRSLVDGPGGLPGGRREPLAVVVGPRTVTEIYALDDALAVNDGWSETERRRRYRRARRGGFRGVMWMIAALAGALIFAAAAVCWK